MAEKDDSLHLNGTSRKFLEEWGEFKEKLLNHLEHSDRESKELKEFIGKYAPMIQRHDIIIKAALVIISMTIGGAITWAGAELAHG